MHYSSSSMPSRHWFGGFSLVEVTVATGIASMGIIMLFGLLPSGMAIFRDATNVSVSAQIAQRLIQEAVQTDYDTLVKSDVTPAPPSTTPVNKGWRYFDEEGIEVPASDISSELTQYHVLTRVLPATGLPVSQNIGPNQSLATVTVQIAVNPTNQDIPVLPNTEGDPLSSTIDPSSKIPFFTFTGHVAKIK